MVAEQETFHQMPRTNGMYLNPIIKGMLKLNSQ
nr:MAG TPA_asm: hypothetical protein [Caudoviricetes sp.]